MNPNLVPNSQALTSSSTVTDPPLQTGFHQSDTLHSSIKPRRQPLSSITDSSTSAVRTFHPSSRPPSITLLIAPSRFAGCQIWWKKFWKRPGVLRFSEGCKAFRLAFKKITKKTASTDDILGPVLSAHKKLVAEKLVGEEAERKVKGEAKKEKHLVGEKGHVKPANYLDSHEKFLIGVATRGVVKLFNAVNKAQHAQKGLNPSRSKDEKVIKKRRKEAFFSVLGQTASRQTGMGAKVGTSAGTGLADAPAWAPLRDNYMLTNSKLKDWDKMPEETAEDDFGLPSDADSSTDDD
ncbi:hypothetical protein ACH5RR_009424 [Cinchona calisaya]|uniref:RRP15-like protein n=1 Tax=Cinchona calisaya TaxID=153742 RepID=A0ABD3AHI5_9GENT